MKLIHNTLPLLAALLLLTCQRASETIAPNDLLYGRWQWVEGRPAGQAIVRPDQSRPTVITFKRSGEYVNEYDGKIFTCCQPNQFVNKGDQLFMSYMAGGYQSPECIYISCAALDPIWHIDTLTTQRLVLTTQRTIGSPWQTVYKALP
jgi:hypothetical protein